MSQLETLLAAEIPETSAARKELISALRAEIAHVSFYRENIAIQQRMREIFNVELEKPLNGELPIPVSLEITETTPQNLEAEAA